MNPDALTPTPAAPSLRSRLLATVIGLSGTREKQFDPSRFTGTPSTPAQYGPPRSVRRSTRVTETEVGGWPVLRISPPAETAGPVLYLHGGAWAAEIRAGHWTFLATLARLTGRAFVVPIYPLVPRATHADHLPVLTSLWSSITATSPAALMGDSAGATIALNLLRALPEGAARPESTILLSPTLDLTVSHPGIAAVAPRDPLLKAEHLRALAALYAGEDGVNSPAVNPMASDLAGLGSVTVFTGTRDILNPDAHRFAERAATAPGTSVDVIESPGMMHDWMLMPLPEAAATTTRIASLLTA
ncbi:acetyl esterase/lipase [Rathayibacter tanaceti]|uniref:Alpha/beta hydrolase fold domain-containing protein n=2 Tax=Rathayibacter tanaceti TaxID=1671680 RepID=A0AAE6RIX5_9MICO|nr:alpha/beta hydrolase fold domain-containing protein [Rathayibacter tanaceti]QHC54523.1 alpha/beta hydrolase fold domain-containing protein [Rathayibacter tanaceti]TCO33924.1 acetyl esterase/lipase [Rathayibacter tanaceti]